MLAARERINSIKNKHLDVIYHRLALYEYQTMVQSYFASVMQGSDCRCPLILSEYFSTRQVINNLNSVIAELRLFN
jgi:hypothetical protein